MHVFVTGGTGTIGSAVVSDLLANGHTVLALARSVGSARTLEAAGASTLRGGLADLDVLRLGAEQSDGVISLAFSPNYNSAEALASAMTEEGAALEALGEQLIGSGRPIVTVSGTPWVPGRASTEADPLPTGGPVAQRARSVTALLALAERGVRSSTVRMPRTVHNQGKGGFAGLLTDAARRAGLSGYPGDGTQRWPAVHALDAAVLFRLALESATAGTVWHAVADEGDPVIDISQQSRSAVEHPGRGGGGGNLRPVRTDLRYGSTLFQHLHPSNAWLATNAPKPARGPTKHPALTPRGVRSSFVLRVCLLSRLSLLWPPHEGIDALRTFGVRRELPHAGRWRLRDCLVSPVCRHRATWSAGLRMSGCPSVACQVLSQCSSSAEGTGRDM